MMTQSLRRFLLGKGYTRVKLGVIETGHLTFEAAINGEKGVFILDTGASNSCVDINEGEKFKLMAEDSEIKAAGAGATNMLTKIAKNNTICVDGWVKDKVTIVLFDLQHVNLALTNHQIENVSGIIGADVLKLGKAIIDYQYNCAYLK